MRLGLATVQDPTLPAVITEDGRIRDYATLADDVERIAETLEPRTLLFISGRNDYPTLLYYLASLARGTVPLLLAADSPPGHLSGLIDLFSPPFVLAPPDGAVAETGLEAVADEDGYRLFRNTGSNHPGLHDDLAFLATTSGSTGSPKLVRLSLDNLTANAASISDYLEISPADRAAASLPLSYSYGLSVVNSHLHAGASFVLSDRSLMEQAFWQQMRDAEITSFAGVPYHYEMLLRLKLDRLNLPSLTKMTQAGGRLDPEKMRAVHEQCLALGIRFWTMYGQTEASPRISYLPAKDTLRKLGSIGVPVPNGRLWVKDEDGTDLSGSGKVGELVYEGPNVCLGYAENAADLALGDVNKGVLATGDLARSDDEGYFYLEGRLRRFLKIYGNRISLDRIEGAVAAKGFECAAHGEDDGLVVNVVEAPGLDTGGLKRDVAAFAGVNPAAVSIVTISELPRLPTGKVDYQCLTQKQ